MFPNFDYVRPKSLQAAIAHLADPGAVVHAGGTDLLGCLREHIFAVKKIVSISAVKELHGISEEADGTLRIGALTPIRTVAEHPLVVRLFRGLAAGAGEVASPQLRNQGTIGGNLCQKPRCWYYRGDFHCLRKGGDTCFAVAGENKFHCASGAGAAVLLFTRPIRRLAWWPSTPRRVWPDRAGCAMCPWRGSTCCRRPTCDVRPSWRRVRSSPKFVSRRRPPEPGAPTARCARGAPGILRWPALRWRSDSTAGEWWTAGWFSAGRRPCRGAARGWSRPSAARSLLPKCLPPRQRPLLQGPSLSKRTATRFRCFKDLIEEELNGAGSQPLKIMEETMKFRAMAGLISVMLILLALVMTGYAQVACTETYGTGPNKFSLGYREPRGTGFAESAGRTICEEKQHHTVLGQGRKRRIHEISQGQAGGHDHGARAGGREKGRGRRLGDQAGADRVERVLSSGRR